MDRHTRKSSNMPVQDREIYGCANFMIKKHEEDASFHAAQRADTLHEAGDLEGQSTWQRIVKAIDALLVSGEGQSRH